MTLRAKSEVIAVLDVFDELKKTNLGQDIGIPDLFKCAVMISQNSIFRKFYFGDEEHMSAPQAIAYCLGINDSDQGPIVRALGSIEEHLLEIKMYMAPKD